MKEQLKQIFDENADCYADTWESTGAFSLNAQMMKKGEVIPAMTEQKLIEIVSELLKNINN